MSASDILTEMLGNMPESYQKTIGFPTYDLLAAVSLRMEGTDTTIDEARQQLDPETCTTVLLTATSIRVPAWSARRRPLRTAA